MTAPDLGAEALERALEEMHAESYGWALSCCGWQEADAEDVLQTTYVKVFGGRARFEGRSSLRTWLFGVIRRTAQEHRRRQRSHRERVERLAVREAGEPVSSRPDDPAERAETRRRLLEALETLPDRQREVLHLVFYQDLSVQEAAEVMEVSVGSARVHYDRGKKKLRSILRVDDPEAGR